MSNFYELSELDKQKIQECIEEIKVKANSLFVHIGKKFEDTTELERQVLAAFSFGMVYAIVVEKELDTLQIHPVSSAMLIEVFHYSEDQAEDFTQELINSTDEEYHPVMYSIIHRGIEGYHQYESNQKRKLKKNILEVLEIVNEGV